MPIAPITGKLRKRLWLDLTTAAGLGTVSAYGYWFVVSVIEPNRLYYYYIPSVRRRQEFYIGLEQKRKEEGAL